ncbi:MAG: hypothetical protein AMXMBFR7_41790 [Planctomycetota bacterium]
MPIVVYCKQCAKKIRAPDSPGKTGRCPRCGAKVPIPESDEAAPPPPEQLAPEYRGLPAEPESRPPAPSPAARTPPSPAAAVAALPEDSTTPHEALDAVEDPPTPREPAEPVKPVVAMKTAETPKPAGKPAARKAETPKPAAETGKPSAAPERKKIRLEAATSPEALARTPGPKVIIRRDQDAIVWDTSPDPPASKAPLVLGLLLSCLVAGGGYAIWYYVWGRPTPRASPEERKREQFKIPVQPDAWDGLRPSGKPSAAPPPPPSAEVPDAPAAPPPADAPPAASGSKIAEPEKTPE